MHTPSAMNRPVAVASQKHPLINRSFGLLWTGQTISLIGTQITGGGLQIAAVLALQATPIQMSLLAALSFIPTLAIGLLAGALVDRLRRRPILIMADLLRALLLLLIPLAAVPGWLRIEHIYIITMLASTLGVFFEVAYGAFLPTLLPAGRLVEGNSKLSASESLAEIAGPSLAGLLIQAFTAPIAILFDSLSFLFSALFLGLIRIQEPKPLPASPRTTLWREVREGWHFLWRHPLLRPLAACSASSNFCGGTFVALYTLYIVRVLGLTPAVYGLLGTMAGAGALLGALVAAGLARHIRPGPLLVGSRLLYGTMAALTPLLGSRELPIIALLLGAQLLGGLGSILYVIREVSLRQEVIPDRFLGRVNACASFITAGATLSGSLLAGMVSEFIGIRLTLIAGACGMALSAAWLFWTPSLFRAAGHTSKKYSEE